MADFRGTIFDFDGVLVDSPHEQARREGPRQLMEKAWSDIRGQTAYAPERFTPEVYQRIMSGKPRYAGALPVLQHFDAVGDSYLEAAARPLAPRSQRSWTGTPASSMTRVSAIRRASG